MYDCLGMVWNVNWMNELLLANICRNFKLNFILILIANIINLMYNISKYPIYCRKRFSVKSYNGSSSGSDNYYLKQSHFNFLSRIVLSVKNGAMLICVLFSWNFIQTNNTYILFLKDFYYKKINFENEKWFLQIQKIWIYFYSILNFWNSSSIN